VSSLSATLWSTRGKAAVRKSEYGLDYVPQEWSEQRPPTRRAPARNADCGAVGAIATHRSWAQGAFQQACFSLAPPDKDSIYAMQYWGTTPNRGFDY